MASLCAEFRDENIAKLRATTDPTDCFRSVTNRFDHRQPFVHLGESWKCWVWWNSTWPISTFDNIDRCYSNKPSLMRSPLSRNSWRINEVSDQRSTESGQIGFFAALGIDPLASTHKWLERASQRLKSKDTTGWYSSPSTDAITPIVILNEAFCELLLWNPKNPFPEVNLPPLLSASTHGVFSLLDISLGRNPLQSSSSVDDASSVDLDDHDCSFSSDRFHSSWLWLDQKSIEIRNVRSSRWFPREKVRSSLPVADLHRPASFLRKLKDILISLSEQVIKTTREELGKHDRAQVIIENEQNIKDAIRAIGEHHVIEHAVFKLLCKSIAELLVSLSRIVLVQRYIHFVHQLLDHPAGAGSSLSNVAIPNGLNLVMNEVISTVSLFLRLITYNKLVFHEHYDRILLTFPRD